MFNYSIVTNQNNKNKNYKIIKIHHLIFTWISQLKSDILYYLLDNVINEQNRIKKELFMSNLWFRNNNCNPELSVRIWKKHSHEISKLGRKI